MRHRLVVVDGFSLLYRAYFGIPTLSTSLGTPTNAVYGFANVLLRLLEDPENHAIVTVFDAPSRTFRHHQDPTYKANRPSMPDELAGQIPVAHELIAALNFPLLMIHGVEADDVIGAVARGAETMDWDVHLLTGDADICQLVNEHIRVLCPRKAMDLVPMDEAAVQEKYGIPPSRLPDWKALAGDPSDNIPGVPGVGPKTATALLKQFQTLDNLYENLEAVSGPRCRSLLMENRERAFLSRYLATIKTDLDLGLNLETELEKWRLSSPDYSRLQELFTRLEFRSLLRRVPSLAAPRLTTELPQQRDYGCITAEDLPRFLDTFLNPSDPRPVSVFLEEVGAAYPVMAVSPAPGVARFLPPGETIKARAFLEDASFLKCLHDAKAAANRLAARGIQLKGVFADISLASYLLNPGRGHHRLDEVIFDCLGVELETFQAPILLFEEAASPSQENPISQGRGHSLCQVADSIGVSCNLLAQRLEHEQMSAIFENIEMPLSPILAQMEQVGVAVDIPFLEGLSRTMGEQMGHLEKEIHQLAGYSFSIHSTRQLQEVLFGKLQLARGKTTKTGFSTDADTLKSLAWLHPLPGKVLEYRELAKLKSTYTDKLPTLVRPETGRIHTSLNQAIASTGRLSSSDPNLQNIPIRTPIGREIRRAFVAEPGSVLLSVDYSQIELRILAHVTGDKELMRAFLNGEDIHAHTAASIFGISVHQVTDDMRRRAKAINFGLMYGMSGFGLAAELGLSRSEAEAYIDQYFVRFPEVKSYFNDTVESAQALGYVSTLLGRRRYIPEINSRKHNVRQIAERAAVNTPIQGTAADIMKLAMIRVSEGLQRNPCKARMILQVHDELVFELPEEELTEILPLARASMEQAMALDVPLVVDARIGPNWGEMKAFDALSHRSITDRLIADRLATDRQATDRLATDRPTTEN